MGEGRVMTRSRRRTLGMTASFAVHALAFLVLTRVVTLHVRTRLASADEPVIQVQIVHLSDGLGRTAPQAPAALQALAPAAPGTPQPPPPPPSLPTPEVDDPAPPGVIAQTSPLDIDPLFRVPFRDAVGQAEAALRAGLGCAHVAVQELPPMLAQRCAEADERLRLAKPGPANTPTPPGREAGGLKSQDRRRDTGPPTLERI